MEESQGNVLALTDFGRTNGTSFTVLAGRCARMEASNLGVSHRCVSGTSGAPDVPTSLSWRRDERVR